MEPRLHECYASTVPSELHPGPSAPVSVSFFMCVWKTNIDLRNLSVFLATFLVY